MFIESRAALLAGAQGEKSFFLVFLLRLAKRRNKRQ